MSTTKAKPCPVCGRQPKVEPYKFPLGLYHASCERVTMGADHHISVDGKGRDAVIKNWNRYVGREGR